MFPDDRDIVSTLVGAYLRQTEMEKAEHGLVPADTPLPARYQLEVDDPGAAFAKLASETGGAAGGFQRHTAWAWASSLRLRARPSRCPVRRCTSTALSANSAASTGAP